MNVKIRELHGYKYQLLKEYRFRHGIDFYNDINFKLLDSDFIELTFTELIFKKWYCWDGASGPAIDTRNFMRGSLIHDGFYQLIREKKIKPNYKKDADRILREECIKDGMSKMRAFFVYWAVRVFGGCALK